MQLIYKTVAKNTFVQIITHVTFRGSGFIIAILAARLWGTTRFGEYAFVMAFTSVFTFMMDMGINLLLVREVARRRDQVNKYLNNSLTLTIVLSLITLFVISQVVRILDYSDNIKFAIYLGSLCTMVIVLNSIFNGIFHAFEKMEYETFSTIVGRVSFLILGASVFILELELLHLLTVLLISTIAQLIVNIRIYYTYYGKIRFEFDRTFLRRLIKLAYPFGLNIAFSMAYLRMNILFLSYFRDNHSIGIYSAGSTIILSFTIIAFAFNCSLLPRMSESFSYSLDKLANMAKKNMAYLVIFSLPLAASLLYLSEEIIHFVYGESYNESIIIFRILSLLVPLKFIDHALASVLTSTDKQGTRTTMMLIAVIFNILTNLYFIPRWGSVGAAVTALITEAFLFALLYINTRKSIPSLFILRLGYKPILAVVAMSLPLYLLSSFNPVLVLTIGLSCYLMVLFFTKTICLDQLFKLRSLVKFG